MFPAVRVEGAGWHMDPILNDSFSGDPPWDRFMPNDLSSESSGLAVDDAEARVRRARDARDAAEAELAEAARTLTKRRNAAAPRFCREASRRSLER